MEEEEEEEDWEKVWGENIVYHTSLVSTNTSMHVLYTYDVPYMNGISNKNSMNTKWTKITLLHTYNYNHAPYTSELLMVYMNPNTAFINLQYYT